MRCSMRINARSLETRSSRRRQEDGDPLTDGGRRATVTSRRRTIINGRMPGWAAPPLPFIRSATAAAHANVSIGRRRMTSVNANC